MNKNPIRNLTIIFTITIYILITLASCSTLTTTETTTTPLASALIAQPTMTQISQQLATTPINQLQIPSVEQQCIIIKDSKPALVNGQLILSGYRRGENNSWIDGQSYILDLQSNTQIPIGKTRYETVSPDGNWLAFYDNTRQTTMIIDKEGQLNKEISSLDFRQFPAYWLNSQNLLLNKLLNNSSNTDDALLIMINPFTGEEKEWSPRYPHQDHVHYYDWQIASHLVFNSAFTRLIYPINKDENGIILWDTLSDKEITRIYDANISNIPRWSPSDIQFVTSAPIRGNDQNVYVNVNDTLPYVGGSDLLLVNSDGEISRLTYFTTNERVGETNFVWSPDGQKIAFVLWDVLHSLTPELMVVNTKTGDIINFCKLATPPLDNQNLAIKLPDPVWSPDGNYLVITEINETYQYKVVLVDVRNGIGWKIADSVSAMGWMAAP